MILAQAIQSSPAQSQVTNFSPPIEIAAWMACLGFFLWICMLVFKAIKIMRGKPAHPPNESLGQSFESMDHRVTILEDWRNDLTNKLERDKMEVLQAGEERASRIHAHIEADRREMDKRLDSLPDRVIATLKNTGAI